ncbi:MAG: Rieske (2Fe-2S) protein [Candidatus Heimdallarchaeota archaeon]|nr:Rieske (2Fe-2S) protein [Candidatus Heimdallarchaeota archaeon]
MTKIKLCGINEIPNRDVKAFNIDNLDIAVFNIDNKFYAIDRKCTHLKGNLAKGLLQVENKTIKCPLHGSVFSLETGNLLTPPGTLAGWFKKAKKTNVYKIEVKDNFLYLIR